MDRAEAAGFGIAVSGHAVLLAILALGLASAAQPPLPLTAPIEVSFVDDIGLVSAAPRPTVEPPAQSMAPDQGPPEDAPPAPLPEPAPPQPQPRPAPPEPAPAPRQAAPAPVPDRAQPQPARERPAPAPKQAAAPARESPRQPSAEAGERTRGSRLGPDLLKGLGSEPSPSRSAEPTGAVMSAVALASIVSAIQRQIQPCANQQVNPGPGANRIQVTVNLRLNRDGSLAARPSVVRTSGVNSENGRYEDRVKDLAIAAFVGCSPLRGLPTELYQTSNGGWSNINLNYRLPD